MSLLAGDVGRGKIVEYAPGLRVDFSERQVQIDGKVCMRQGMLELFACTAHTREHESVVVVKPQPKRIFEALGLIGLKEGHPIRYDEKTKTWESPSGDLVNIFVEWADDGRRRRTHIGDWLQPVGTDKPLSAQSWVFAGSFTTEAGTFTADADGTVISVVDFPSALIAYPGQNSANNDLLWLEARSEAIPPLGTDVTIIVSPAVAELVVEMRSKDDVRCDGHRIGVADVRACFEKFRKNHRHYPVISVRILSFHDAPQDKANKVADLLRKLAKDAGEVRVIRLPRPFSSDIDPTAPKRDIDKP